jgi:hypothetical protein
MPANSLRVRRVTDIDQGPPLWTALPSRLDLLLERMTDVIRYPERARDGRATCGIALIDPMAPDPHDWRDFREGQFLAIYNNRIERWQLRLRMCVCGWVEVRKEGLRGVIPSARTLWRRRPVPGQAELIVGYYQSK